MGRFAEYGLRVLPRRGLAQRSRRLRGSTSYVEAPLSARIALGLFAKVAKFISFFLNSISSLAYACPTLQPWDVDGRSTLS